MSQKNFLLFPFIVLLVSFGCATTQVSKESVTIITDDQKKLGATYYPASSPNSPGVILVPDTRCDRKKSFGRFPSKINKAGFAVLALDLRYKDLIARTRDREEAIGLIQKQDLYALVKFDMRSAIDFLSRQQEVNPERIALIGTSLGTRVGLISGVKYKVKALVLVSLSGQEALPGGKSIKQLLEEYGNRPILFMTSEKDWGGNYKAAEHNKLYFNWAKGEKELKIWPGSGHGPDILNIEGASEFVLSWLKDNL
jgi:dienelactone hydrolase